MLSGASLNNELITRYERWLGELDYSPHVQNAYPNTVRRFCDSVEGRSVLQTTPWDVREFLIHESGRKLTYPTIRQFFGILQNFSQFLKLGGIRGRIPLDCVRMKAVGPRRPPIVSSPSTILKLVAAARLDRDVALVELLYATGCRPIELVRAKVSDVDLESRKMRVRGKNDSVRYVVFGDKAVNAIKAYLHGRTTGYLFQSIWTHKGCVYPSARRGTWIGEIDVVDEDHPRGRRRSITLGLRKKITLDIARVKFEKWKRGLSVLNPRAAPLKTNTIRHILNLLALRAGIKEIAPSTIRHCFATHMLDGGADTRDIQELLGHRYLTSTQIYTHVSRRRLAETFDRCHPRGNRNHDYEE
jgi:site-specific recombinase XerD